MGIRRRTHVILERGRELDPDISNEWSGDCAALEIPFRCSGGVDEDPGFWVARQLWRSGAWAVVGLVLPLNPPGAVALLCDERQPGAGLKMLDADEGDRPPQVVFHAVSGIGGFVRRRACSR